MSATFNASRAAVVVDCVCVVNPDLAEVTIYSASWRTSQRVMGEV